MTTQAKGGSGIYWPVLFTVLLLSLSARASWGQVADLSMTKTDGVTTATPGLNITYTIVVANAGPNTDPAVTVADTFRECATLSWKLKRPQTPWFDEVKGQHQSARERSRDEESATCGQETQEVTSVG